MKMQYTIKMITQEEAEAIKRRYTPKGLFLYKQGAYTVALDNACGDVWERKFRSKAEAQEWLISI